MTDKDPTGWSNAVETGSPTLEHAVFVLIGMLATVAIIVHIYLVFVG